MQNRKSNYKIDLNVIIFNQYQSICSHTTDYSVDVGLSGQPSDVARFGIAQGHSGMAQRHSHVMHGFLVPTLYPNL